MAEPAGARRRERARAAALAGIGLAAHALLLAGALAWLPDWLRVGLATSVVILLPGSALLTLGLRPGRGGWTDPVWVIGLGVAWNALLLFALFVARQSFLPLAGWTLAANAVLWALALAWPLGQRAPASRTLPAWSSLAIALAMAVACVHVARLGPPMGYSSDSPEYVSTLRYMLETGEVLPGSAYHPDVAPPGSDARKSLWHGVTALVVRLSGLEPAEAWRWLGLFLVPLFVLNAAALGRRVGGAPGAAVAAWACVLVSGGGLGQSPLRQAAFASRLADQLVLAAVLAVLADLGAPRRGTRFAAAALAFGAVAVHLGAALQLAVALGALLIGLLVRDRGLRPVSARLTATAALMAAAALPYALVRLGALAPAVNVLHTEPQGLLLLTDRLRVISPGLLWEQMGVAWLLVPLAWPWLWTRGRDDPAVLYLFAASLAAALIVYNPLAVAVLEPRVGYLMWRLVWLVPFPGLLGWMLPRLVEAARSGPELRGRLLSATALAGTLLLLVPAGLDAARLLAEPGLLRDADRNGPGRIQDVLRWMDRNLPAGRTVLSDPATSYVVPMRTRHVVTHLADQHSSPGDAEAVRRILDARDALDPYGDWERTREVVRRYGVDVIALNGRFEEPPRLDLWAPSRPWFAASRARFDAHPAAFEALYDSGDFVVYGIRGAALDTLDGPPRPRPFVRPWRGSGGPIGRRMGEGLPALLGLSLSSRRAAPGDTLHAVIRWRAPQALPAGSYQVALRFDRDLPGGLEPPAVLGKPVRKVLERLHGERYRFRIDHLPVNGQYGVDLWRSDQVIDDSLGFAVPRDAAEGIWRVEARMLRQPHYPNLRLSDYFFDRDYFSGLPVGTLRLERRPVPGGGEAE